MDADGGGAGRLDMGAETVDPSSLNVVDDATETVGAKLGGSVNGVSIKKRACTTAVIVEVLAQGTDDGGGMSVPELHRVGPPLPSISASCPCLRINAYQV
jgi:hypothetical protein